MHQLERYLRGGQTNIESLCTRHDAIYSDCLTSLLRWNYFDLQHRKAFNCESYNVREFTIYQQNIFSDGIDLLFFNDRYFLQF